MSAKTNYPTYSGPSTRPVLIIVLSGSVAMLVTMDIVTYRDVAHPNVCTNTEKVKNIVSVNYRSATVLLENGKTVVVNQGSLKPGSPHCLKYKRQ